MTIATNGKREIMRQRPSEKIRLSIDELALEHAKRASTVGCFLHCRQIRSARFYKDLQTTFGVKAIRQKRGKIVDSVIGLTIGYQAMIVIDNSKQIVDIFPLIVEQALASIYFFDAAISQDLRALAEGEFSDFESMLREDESHLIYTVDEDSAIGLDLVTEIIDLGLSCPREFCLALALDSAIMG